LPEQAEESEMIAIDVFVIYALIVHGREVRALR
jgi:hypothetical protein